MNEFVDMLGNELGLADSERNILNAIDVRTFEDLHSVTQAFPSLAKIGLQLPRLSNKAYLNLGEGFVAFAENAEEEKREVAMGALPPPDAAMTINATVGLPPENLPLVEAVAEVVGAAASAIDLRLNDWPVRDQGNRGTCVSFGTTACIEHYKAQTGHGADLSEQFLYWAIKTHTADPAPAKDGTWLEFARAALQSHGICAEADWRYVEVAVNPISGALPGRPGATALANAAGSRMLGAFHARSPGAAAATALSLLRDNLRPVAICLPVFVDPLTPDGATNWTTPVGWSYGTVINPPPTSKVKSGHCVCITGFVPDASEPQGGYFIIRNSWDRDWGSRNGSGTRAPEPGYGSISASYVNTYCWELFQL